MDIILKYFPQLSDDKKAKIASLKGLYSYWNNQINVISRKDIDVLYERHVLHSLAIHKFLPFTNGSKIMDIGTGGGFPGIPLAIMQPEVEFLLVDSIGKKIKVVQEIANELGLTNVKAMHERAERVSGKFDFVVSRAVAPLEDLVKWSNGKILSKEINAIPNGLICLKGGDLKDELAAVKRFKEVHELNQYFNESFFETKKLIYVSI